ncbi:cysteine-rich repeat secretory protein [Musa troglodytarum]|uniref:Cysteine-rich repeat secretory protein n=1 Tax=Musa troglodytarum TaxID=320322 RepID=A0A9E7I4C3_9LILI|nr:cysteine-rich repeat secretory protein [Musa troglodytarum]
MALLQRLLLLFLWLPLSAAAADSIALYCSNRFNGKQTQANIDHVLADLVARASVGGFATSSSGNGASGIYGLAQCRGDVSADDCSTCLAEAAKKLPTACPSQADGRIWYDYCFMRYDNENFVGQSDTGVATILINVENATDPENFDKKVGVVMGRARADAVAPGNNALGRAKLQFTPYITIYALAQCTRDLQQLTCAQCLSSAVEKFPDYCQYRKGCQVLYSSCIVRYEIYPFYFPLDSTKTAAAVGTYYKATLHP